MHRHCLDLCFFFSSRRRHTRWPRDWSSDVCSSDLSLAIIPLGHTGWVYGVSAVLVGAWFGFLVVRYAVRTRRGLSGKQLAPMSVFHGSITYLTLLFVALAIDPFVTL